MIFMTEVPPKKEQRKHQSHRSPYTSKPIRPRPRFKVKKNGR